jgi:hypothetical protein
VRPASARVDRGAELAKRCSKHATGSLSVKHATITRSPTPGTSGAAFGHHDAFGFGVKQSAIAIGDFSITPGRSSRVSQPASASSDVFGSRSVHTSTTPG